MKRALIGMFLVAALLAVGAVFLIRQVNHVVLKQREEAEATALIEASRSARKGRIPFDWSAAAFVPTDVLTEAAELTRGMKVLVPPGNGLPPDVSIELAAMKLSSENGYATVDLDLVAKAPSRGVELSLNASGVLRYLGQDDANPAPEGWRSLKFGIDLIEVRPTATIGLFQFKIRAFAARLLASGVAASLGEKCTVSIPVPSTLHATMELEGKEAFKAGDASIGVSWQLPAFQLREKVEIAGPLFTRKGVWLLADRQSTTPTSTDSWQPTIEEAHHVIADALAAAPEANGQALAWLNRTVLEGFAASVNEIMPRASAKVTSVDDGRLYYEEWQFLGTGKAEVNLNGVAGEGSIQVGTIATGWKPNEGIQVTVPLVGEASVPIHIHLDPGPTGGAGFNVGMKGSIPVSLSPTLRPEIVILAGKKTFILRPGGNPQKISLQITTDGKFKCSVGTAHVAKVGALITADLNPNGVPPLLLFSEVPTFVNVAAQGVKLPNAGFELSAAPEHLSLSDNGLLLGVRLRLRSSDGRGRHAAELAEVRQACRKLAVDEPFGNIDVTILIAGLQFSQSNDIVRFFGNAIHDLTKGPGRGNEFVKATNTVAHDLTHGLGPNNDIRKWFRCPGAETEKFFASTADKAAGLAQKGGKALENLGGKIKEDIIKRPGHNINPKNWRW